MRLTVEEFAPRRKHKRDNKRGIVPTDPVFRVVDADTGRILDDNKGYGFSRPDEVLENWKKRVTRPRFLVELWMEEHPAVGALLFEVVFDVEMGCYGDVAIDDAFFAQILKVYGLELPVPGDIFYQTMGKLVDKYMRGEICGDRSLAHAHRVERARNIKDAGLRQCMDRDTMEGDFD